MKPIPDKAEVALEFPDKFYIGTFERSSDFDVHLDEIGIALTLHHGGDDDVRRSVRMHIRHMLFAEILSELAKNVACGTIDESHRVALARAATAFAAALHDPEKKSGDTGKAEEMTPEEEVALLHVLE